MCACACACAQTFCCACFLETNSSSRKAQDNKTYRICDNYPKLLRKIEKSDPCVRTYVKKFMLRLHYMRMCAS